MAARVFLIATDDPHETWPPDPRRAVLAEGVHCVPLFWASVFTPADMTLDVYPGGDRELKVRNPCVASATARARLRPLGRVVRSHLGPTASVLWDQWHDLIDRQRARYLKVLAAEIWAAAPRSYASYWSSLTRAFREPSARTIRAAARRNGLAFDRSWLDWSDVDETLVKLAGTSHLRAVPWFGRRRREFDPPLAEPPPRPNVYDAIFAAASPDDTLAEARRKARKILGAASRPNGRSSRLHKP